ncbi:cyclic nucleotide-binding domain-containing protein [bacterium]|nr:cyclic nucleotide-binding domain-containing protein [bacterium]
MIEFEILRNVSLFKGLDEDELERVLTLAFTKNYKKNYTLFFEGMSGGIMYVIITGQISIFKNSKEGAENFLLSLKAGDYLGEISLIEEDKRSATAKLSEESKLLVITRKCFNDMIYKEPRIASKILFNIAKKLSSRLKEMNERLIKLETEKNG